MEKINSIDEYIEMYPENIRKILNRIRKIINKNIPMAEERISWGMPTFYWKENIIHFAVGKNHIGIYPSASPIIYFENELVNYKTSKGAIQLPQDKPIPYDLIERIVKFRIEEIHSKYNNKEYKFKSILEKSEGIDGAYIRIPFDIKKEFGKGRVKVIAVFEGIEYSGSIVNMGIKNSDGSICYIIGVTKEIRNKIGKSFGDSINMTIKER